MKKLWLGEVIGFTAPETRDCERPFGPSYRDSPRIEAHTPIDPEYTHLCRTELSPEGPADGVPIRVFRKVDPTGAVLKV